MMKADGIGLYVHIPFCVRKCNYCDFCSIGGASDTAFSEYTDALLREIAEYDKSERIKIDTLFFGGGTPSLLPTEYFEKIVKEIKRVFDLTLLREFTVEANPKTLTKAKCEAYKLLGVNRISIGLQSIHENEMRALGRVHTLADFEGSYKMAREYFPRVSVDLMYGIPEQTLDSFGETLRFVMDKAPEHISVYGLIIEEGTPFFSMRDKLPLPDEDEECDMYAMAAQLLSKQGYRHYEISNYALAGCECEHNLKYWRDMEYIGLGVAAASYFGKKRYANTADLSEYLKRKSINYRCKEEVPDEPYEYVMLRLRLAEGFSLSEYRTLFGMDFKAGREEKIEKYERLGYLKCSLGRIALTESGFYISNYLLAELL